MKILFLANRPTKGTQATTVLEYLDSFSQFSKHEIFEISMLHQFPSNVDLNKFDCVMTHYSLSLGSMIEHYLGQDLINKLEMYRGLKVAFLQDEYRNLQVCWENLNKLGINVLFSCVPDEEVSKVYPSFEVPNLKVVNVLTGYVSEALVNASVPRIKDRNIDVGYRTRKPPFWLGKLGYEKWWISKQFTHYSKNYNLILDFSDREGHRLYGDAWTDFICSCKAMIGVESGASIIDIDGKLEAEVEKYCEVNPNASFEEVHLKFLQPYEGSLRLNQISPRCFEAAALRTPMILFEGFYSGILLPHRHYLPLKKDFSNFDEVIKKLEDYEWLEALAQRTFLEVALNPKYSYQQFISDVDSVLLVEHQKLKRKFVENFYSPLRFKLAVFLSVKYTFTRFISLAMQRILLGTPLLRKIIFSFWSKLPTGAQALVRPFARFVSR